MTQHSLRLREILLLTVWVATAVAVASHTAAAAEPATRPTAGENPDYAKWARLKEGAWVRVRILSTNRTAEWTSRLVKVTPDEVILDVAEAKPGEPPSNHWDDRVPATLKDAPPAPAQQSGDENVPVADQSVACRWETRTSHKPGEVGDSGETVWASPVLPGFVKRVSWLAADKDAGLPATKALERLVAYDLPPKEGAAATTTRPSTGPATGPAAAQPLATKAAPPAKFAWTYRFDPPGRRDWSRTDVGHWEERWESGQVVKFEITRWIDEGDVRGTVVRRLPDRDLETVIPDAGKDAPLFFRHLPDGKWSLLGKLEESS